MRARWARRLLSGASLLLCACGTTQAATKTRTDPWAVDNLYPLAVNNAWSYEVDTGEDGGPILTTVRVTERTGAMVVVQSGQERLQYRAEAGQLRRVDGGTVLKAPVAVGESWASGPTTQAQVVGQVDGLVTPAGTFDGCVEVRESDGRTGKLVSTTYCPGVGPARVVSELQLQRGNAQVTALLRGFLVAPQ